MIYDASSLLSHLVSDRVQGESEIGFLIPSSGKIGYRVQFVCGLTVFVLASLGCALSTSIYMLVFMRLLQGLGGAATLSIAPALLKSVFPNRLLGRILGLNALLIALCTAVGPILGGTLLSLFRWEWLFAINVPLGIVAVILIWQVIPRHTRSVISSITTHANDVGSLLS